MDERRRVRVHGEMMARGVSHIVITPIDEYQPADVLDPCPHDDLILSYNNASGARATCQRCDEDVTVLYERGIVPQPNKRRTAP